MSCCNKGFAALLAFGLLARMPVPGQKDPLTKDSVRWRREIQIADPPSYEDSATDARKLHPGVFGGDYPRAVRLKDNSWLCTYTGFENGNQGYRPAGSLLNDPHGGNRIFVLKSMDGAKTWKQIAMLSDPGRDMDNGEMIQLADGSILLGTRSVRWQESYRLPVFRSVDKGMTWKYLSNLDENEGKPGELGHPDKGVYEPHFYQLDAQTLAVMYSTEKHVTENPSYSQTVAEKLSRDQGATWGKEISVAAGGARDRPGMPVWVKLKNGSYLVTYEVCGPQHCQIYSKISADAVHWEPGLGIAVPSQLGAPYLLALQDGRLILTSNNHNVSMSNDDGKSWQLVVPAFEGGPKAAFFSSIYEVSPNEVMIMTGLERPQGGRRIVARFGKATS